MKQRCCGHSLKNTKKKKPVQIDRFGFRAQGLLRPPLFRTVAQVIQSTRTAQQCTAP
ncbi:hypothetical protein IscW_ISCW002973 [Ixodes scapularis]|uniref:Uncharacterized protein n=1 Tax=Ixodes scapularis TaxID=6945 RepID=B7P8G0_IXOSC|nr:hypothetical protein IscW_ISCW002973 [Ixodes scapularis]|eukprot:XP_002401927.1 hypothetical protein IscW_ISCW002973 [Ixodes scapularis]